MNFTEVFRKFNDLGYRPQVKMAADNPDVLLIIGVVRGLFLIYNGTGIVVNRETTTDPWLPDLSWYPGEISRTALGIFEFIG